MPCFNIDYYEGACISVLPTVQQAACWKFRESCAAVFLRRYFIPIYNRLVACKSCTVFRLVTSETSRLSRTTIRFMTRVGILTRSCAIGCGKNTVFVATQSFSVLVMLYSYQQVLRTRFALVTICIRSKVGIN